MKLSKLYREEILKEANDPLDTLIRKELNTVLKPIITDNATRTKVIFACQSAITKVLVDKKILPF